VNSIEVLTKRLNACKHPREIYNALLALASSIDAQNAEDPREAVCQWVVKRDVPRKEVKHA